MKLAIPCENGQIFQHFGKAKQFQFYEITETREILDLGRISPTIAGHRALAAFLREQQANAVLCGGIGDGAQIALAQAGIELYGGVSGNCFEAATEFANGTLRWNPLLQFGGCSFHCSETCGNTACSQE